MDTQWEGTSTFLHKPYVQGETSLACVQGTEVLVLQSTQHKSSCA